MPTIVIVTTAIVSLLAYFGLVFFFIAGWRKTQIAANPSVSHLPFISVVVAFRNEAHNLPALLNAIEKQTFNRNGFEVILVNDNSSDQWENTIPNTVPYKLSVIPNTGIGKKQAIRTGVEAAQGTMVLVTDADCTPHPSWISAMAQHFASTKADLLIGPVVLHPKKGFFHFFQQADFMSLQLSGAGAAINGRPIMCNGANLAFDRTFYLETPHLNHTYSSGDDMFLLHRAKELQKNIRYTKTTSAVVTTQPQASLKQLIKQRIRWGAKAKGYTDYDTMAVALVVALANFSIVALCAASFIVPQLWQISAAAIFTKGICEYPLFKFSKQLSGPPIATSVFGLRYWAIQLLHPFFTTAIIVAALTTNVSWKNRPTINRR